MNNDLKFNNQIFNLDELNNTNFNIDAALENARNNISDYQRSKYCRLSIDSDIWYLYNSKYQMGRYINFNIDYLPSLKSNNEMNIVLKCWIASLINSYSLYTITTAFSIVKSALKITNGFTEEAIDEFELWIGELNSSYKSNTLSALYNFLDFYNDFQYYNEYLSVLSNFSYSAPNVRTIPSVKDCLNFAWVLEDFYRNTTPDRAEYLLFFPVLIWWKLTTIIPIRSLEFINIRRDSFKEENGEYFISLPRIKENKSRVQVIDTFQLDKKTGALIKEYIELSDENGYSESLLSYASYKKNSQNTRLKKEPERFNISILHSLIDRFYKEVISKEPYLFTIQEYTENKCLDPKIKYDIYKKLNPNDTRHLAFLFLMMQGLHPIEIARLGGHNNIYTQRHYMSHESFFLDSEVIKLFNNFSINKEYLPRGKSLSSNTTSNFNTIINKKFKENFIFTPAILPRDKWEKLDIGYCTASKKKCEDHCFNCVEYWRIDKIEFKEKRKEIIRWINLSNNKIKETYTMLLNIHKLVLSSNLDEINVNLINKLNSTSKNLRDLLHKNHNFHEQLRSWECFD